MNVVKFTFPRTPSTTSVNLFSRAVAGTSRVLWPPARNNRMLRSSILIEDLDAVFLSQKLPSNVTLE